MILADKPRRGGITNEIIDERKLRINSKMNMIEIESAEYYYHYYITRINEPEDNSLEFDLFCGFVSENEEDVIVGDVNLGPGRRILMNENYKYTIKFKSYIAYSVLNENYADKPGEVYTGDNPRIYSSSNFLDYIMADTFVTKDYPGEFKHYAFLSANHFINVVSLLEPIIEKVIL